jgi:hypothetical protein
LRALVSIAGHDLPEPSTYSSTTATTVDGARNAQSVYIGAVIREDQAKVECTWKFISAEDWSTILKLFSSKYGGAFVNSVTFFCQDTNAWETRDMYVSDRTSDMFLRRADGSVRGYVNPRLALVEV